MIVDEDDHVAQYSFGDHINLWDNDDVLTCLEQATFGESDSSIPTTAVCPTPFYPPHLITHQPNAHDKQSSESVTQATAKSLRVNRVWGVLIDALSGLHDCRRLDPFHASSIHRISTILLYLSRCVHHPSHRGRYGSYSSHVLYY